MSSKLQRIIDAVADRLAVINTGAGYYTDIGNSVFRNQRDPQENELPCCLVFFGERAAETQQCENIRTAMTITVIGYTERLSDSEDQGTQILADIQRAVELADDTLGGLLRGQFGLAFVSDEIFMPEVGANAAGARVTYSAPHVRIYGDPEIV